MPHIEKLSILKFPYFANFHGVFLTLTYDYIQMKSLRKPPMTANRYLLSFLFIWITLFSFFPAFSISANTLSSKQSLSDNQNQSLVSEGGLFEVGFFSPGISKKRYLGIWYHNILPLTVVWVANRKNPLTDLSGYLTLNECGDLLLLNQTSNLIWSSNKTMPSNSVEEQMVAKLLDSGNLIIKLQSSDEKDQRSYKWQSFDHATNTLLPGMRIGWDVESGLNNTLTSWSNPVDPSPGNYTVVMDHSAAPEGYVLREQIPVFRSGPWNGLQFSGVPDMSSECGFEFTFMLSAKKKYYSYNVDRSLLSRVILSSNGKLQRLVWIGNWSHYWDLPKDECDNYKECGSYGICDPTVSPVCSCVRGFVPKNERQWNLRDGSEGCLLNTTYECGKDDGFLKLKRMKPPDCSKSYYNQSMDLQECREMCRRNCSCSAYANLGVTSGCIIWIGDLLDLRKFAKGGQDLYVRVAASELDDGHTSIAIVVTLSVISSALVLGLIIFFTWKWKKRTQKKIVEERVRRVQSQRQPRFDMFSPSTRHDADDHENNDSELPLMDFNIVVSVTDNFADYNKLGEGGFGSVYKGTLADGQQIAVKRLAKNSGQGIDEFKNEVLLIAKLQHRNLVRLLGCCIGHEEKMLIYEYMPNKSLNSILFDKAKGQALDWGKRFKIIVGIARGLLYLHQDSRLRIIHRDLKASNILLDAEMTPKISDFGMARIFGSDQTEANTKRVMGTYGYMAPEYAMDGLFSIKSDVFSYGVLVLEIVSGKQNRGFYSEDDNLNLLGHAWKLWEEGNILELMDKLIWDTSSVDEVLKCIHIGLLCIQEHAEDRPNISSVILMLGTETATLALPKQPGFSLVRTHHGQGSCSVNQVTLTVLEPR